MARNNKRKRPISQTPQNGDESTEASSAVAGENFNSEVPKKKKKKNNAEETKTTSDKNISKRQMKKDKHAQRVAEAEANSHKAVQQQALSYLSLWKFNKAEWKFSKVKQIWLCKHKFDNTQVPDELWKPFVEYFASATGGVKQLIIQDSKKVIEEMEAWIEKNQEADNPETKPSESEYQRARDLIQNIQE